MSTTAHPAPSGEGVRTTIVKDLTLNFRKLTEDGALDREEALLTTLALATALSNPGLTSYAEVELRERGFDGAGLQEARESTAIMAMLNTYYRFRHMIGESDDYRSTGLRMQSLARPALGKERFEMLAFALSVLNGCEQCVRSHEQALKAAAVPAPKIHDLARLASVVRGLATLEATPHLGRPRAEEPA